MKKPERRKPSGPKAKASAQQRRPSAPLRRKAPPSSDVSETPAAPQPDRKSALTESPWFLWTSVALIVAALAGATYAYWYLTSTTLPARTPEPLTAAEPWKVPQAPKETARQAPSQPPEPASASQEPEPGFPLPDTPEGDSKTTAASPRGAEEETVPPPDRTVAPQPEPPPIFDPEPRETGVASEDAGEAAHETIVTMGAAPDPSTAVQGLEASGPDEPEPPDAALAGEKHPAAREGTDTAPDFPESAADPEPEALPSPEPNDADRGNLAGPVPDREDTVLAPVEGGAAPGAEDVSRHPLPFSVHADSMRSPGVAWQKVRDLREKGLPAYWVRAYLGSEKGTWYRVMIGWYATEAEATQVIEEKALPDARPLKTAFACLVGVYPTAGAADEQAQVLEEKGYAPYAVENAGGARSLYVGAFVHRLSAENRAEELASLGVPSQVVAR